ncbi:conserved hypothetical protein [Gammaproteobacteria bacterium]
MANEVSLLRLQDAWHECERHSYHLFYAISSLRTVWPLTGIKYATLTDIEVQGMDQFILRFTKLQDTIGSHLLPAILQYLEEPYERRPMLDKLNRLEKLGFIYSIDKWQDLRSIRNKFAHDYPDDTEKNAAQLNLAFASAPELYAMLIAIQTKLKSDHPSLDLGKYLPEKCPV